MHMLTPGTKVAVGRAVLQAQQYFAFKERLSCLISTSAPNGLSVPHVVN